MTNSNCPFFDGFCTFGTLLQTDYAFSQGSCHWEKYVVDRELRLFCYLSNKNAAGFS